MQRFIVIDLETTGLLPKEDFILEVAWTLTDYKLGDSTRIQHHVVTPEQAAFIQIKQSPFIQGMHGPTGLLHDLMEPDTQMLDTIEDWILGDMKRRTNEGDTWHLAGSSVGFDRAFIDEHMPRLAEKLHYRILDVSTLRMIANASGLAVEESINEMPHRAANDVEWSLNYARSFISTIEDAA